VTIDAMGCQTDIADKIIEKKANYVLAIKGNQKNLYEAIIDYFAIARADKERKTSGFQRDENTDAGHGRIETRRCFLSTCLTTLPEPERWTGLKSIAMVESERTVGDKTSIEQRYYITTLTDVSAFAYATRAHWGVENSLHWVLDVTFKEDDSRIRTGYAPENFNIIRQLAINILKKDSSTMSLKRKRFIAGLDDQFMEKLLFQN
jgi:predicted transposase YbfD/YdcC